MNPARRSLLAYGADIPDLMRRGAALGITAPPLVMLRADTVTE